jgi:hypothetical protein
MIRIMERRATPAASSGPKGAPTMTRSRALVPPALAASAIAILAVAGGLPPTSQAASEATPAVTVHGPVAPGADGPGGDSTLHQHHSAGQVEPANGCAAHAQHQNHPVGPLGAAHPTQPSAPRPVSSPHRVEPGALPAAGQAAGQAAFGAIAEVVAVLDADPATDWSRVDLLALREHLVDMDRLMLDAAVVEEPVPGGFRTKVTAKDARTRAAIARMVPAHAAMVSGGAGGAGLAAAVREIDGGVELTVTAADPGDRAAVDRLRGLGFYGFMALGDHHRPHHLALARGLAMHGG